MIPPITQTACTRLHSIDWLRATDRDELPFKGLEGASSRMPLITLAVAGLGDV